MGRAVHYIEVQTSAAEEFIDLTARIRALVQQSGVSEGLAVVHCPHTTAALVIQENADPVLKEDILEALEAAVPKGRTYRHAEGNAAAHVKAAMLGSGATVLISGGKLLLGTWQAIYFVELDGPRRRTIQVKLVAD